MKRLFFILLMLINISSFASVKPLPWDKPIFKPTSTITYTFLSKDGSCWPNSPIHFAVGISETNTIDYRVVVGIWSYIYGFYNCNQVKKCYGWHWEYVYRSLIIPAGQLFADTGSGSSIWTYNCQGGEIADTNNWYISFYGPN